MHSKAIANPIAIAIANALAKRWHRISNVSVSVIASVSVRGSSSHVFLFCNHPSPARHLGDVARFRTAGTGC